MARGKVNKAAKIREAFESLGSNARPKDVIASLRRQKVNVSSAQVSGIKAKLGQAKVKPRAQGDATNVSIDHLLAAKKFRDVVGSIEKARSVVGALARLLG